jgi:PAS domain S-box-containing protein
MHSFVESAGVIAETASDAIITINEESTILFVNGATSNIFGYTAEELIGSQLTMLMPEYLRHLHTAGLHNYLETGNKHISWEAVELPGLHKSGKQLALELSFGEFEKDGHRFFTGIARDIDNRDTGWCFIASGCCTEITGGNRHEHGLAIRCFLDGGSGAEPVARDCQMA